MDAASGNGPLNKRYDLSLLSTLSNLEEISKLETIHFPYGSDDVSVLYDLPDLTILWE